MQGADECDSKFEELSRDQKIAAEEFDQFHQICLRSKQRSSS